MRNKKIFITFLFIFLPTLLLPSFTFSGNASSTATLNFQRLSSAYTVSYGSSFAPTKITQFFSLACPRCLQFIRGDFQKIKNEYINTGQVQWTFHPDPADLPTLQAMVCLELLNPLEKQIFLSEMASKSRFSSTSMHVGMKKILLALKKPLPPLESIGFLEKTRAFRRAYSYVQQPQAPTQLPTIEVGGKFFKDIAPKKILDILQNLVSKGPRS